LVLLSTSFFSFSSALPLVFLWHVFGFCFCFYTTFGCTAWVIVCLSMSAWYVLHFLYLIMSTHVCIAYRCTDVLPYNALCFDVMHKCPASRESKTHITRNDKIHPMKC
jgi:hypothetical protein